MGGRTPAIVPTYAVIGSELFLRGQAIQRIIEQVRGTADRSRSLSEYDGSKEELSLASVLDDVRTLPFLSERRLVLVRDADKFITRYRRELEDYVQQPSPTGVLVLECKVMRAGDRLYKFIDKHGEVVSCEAPKTRDLPGWLMRYTEETYSQKLDPRAATRLVDTCGSGLGLLAGELHKLSLYAGERKTITTADVEAAGGSYREEEIWGLLSKLAEGDLAGALGTWEQVMETDRSAEHRSLAGLAYKIRALAAAVQAKNRGASLPELRRMLWPANDQQVHCELNAFRLDELEDMLSRLCEADVAIKAGRASARARVEQFIVEMCRKPVRSTQAVRR